jgi:hypothetical protein
MKSLTEEEFSKHIGTRFRPELGEHEVNLTLTEVKRYMPEPSEEKGLERFSVFFDGPSDVVLPQQTYHLQHEAMGEFDIFLGPIAQNANGFRYEAVFNYYKDKPE